MLMFNSLLQVNESEIPLLHEHNGAAEEIATLVEASLLLIFSSVCSSN